MAGRTAPARLWAPWRMRYVAGAEPPAGCLFCRVWKDADDRRDLVLIRRAHGILMLNRFPYNPGHLMAAVARHTGRFAALRADERTDLFDLIARAETALGVEYRPHGMNYGANAGRVAGAGFAGHLHVHLVPRWNGDTNFMPLIGGSKVLPERLEDTWRRLRRALRAANAGRKRGQPR